MRDADRYELHGEIAAGGMAAVHLGRLVGAAGFMRTVAIKRLYPQLARDPAFVSMFIDEARLAARIRHPNVVATLDVVAVEGQLSLVMEYVVGESLGALLESARQRGELVPPAIAASILLGALAGLHAAHEARSESGEPLDIVHRDVSPQNILVSVDGVPRILDFGIAKARVRVHATRDGQLKGKLRYMAPEQLEDGVVDRTTDVRAAGVVLWEALTGERLFAADSEGAIVSKILDGTVPPPSALAPGLPAALDAVVGKALARDPAARFRTAKAMQIALEQALAPTRDRELGEWVERNAGATLAARAALVAAMESGASPRDEAVVTEVPAPTETLVRPLRVEGATERPRASRATERIAPAGSEPTSTLTMTSVAPVARMQAGPVPRTSRRIAWVALGGALVLGVAIAGERLGRSSATSGPAVATGALPSPPPPPAPSPAATDAPATLRASTASAAAPVESTARPDAPPASPPLHRPIVRATVPAPGATAAPSAVAPSCDPPYVQDASGFRHVKRECL